MEDKNYKVYVHRVITDDGPMYYVGCTKQKYKNRWQPLHYQSTSLWTYIEQYGWDNIEHYIVAQNLTYEEAKKYEDDWIISYRKIGRCINKVRSGLYTTKEEAECKKRQAAKLAEIERKKDEKEAEKAKKAKKAYKGGDQEYKEYQLSYMRRKLATPEGKIYNRVNAYNNRHPDLATETPLEAKRKYIDSGGMVIPQYIKHDDLS